MAAEVVDCGGAALGCLEATPPLVEAEREEFPPKSHPPEQRGAYSVFSIERVAGEEGDEDRPKYLVGVVKA